jgi:hypothetical protein
MGEFVKRVIFSFRHRAQRRNSAWNLILIPLGFAGWLGTWYGLFLLVWAFHVKLYPQHNLRDFWGEGVSFSSFIPGFLMVFALMPGAVCLGFIRKPANKQHGFRAIETPVGPIPSDLFFLWSCPQFVRQSPRRGKADPKNVLPNLTFSFISHDLVH